MTTTNRALLSFYTNDGSIARITVPRACINTSPQVALAAMEAIISTEAVLTAAGIPRTVRGAEIVQTHRVVLA